MVKQAEEVASNGGKEIVLTGVNIGDFGKSTGETFIDLIRALDKVEDRTLPYLLHRTEPDHGRGDRFRGMQQTFRSSFSYSVTERK